MLWFTCEFDIRRAQYYNFMNVKKYFTKKHFYNIFFYKLTVFFLLSPLGEKSDQGLHCFPCACFGPITLVKQCLCCKNVKITSEPEHSKTYNVLRASNKDSDQPAQCDKRQRFVLLCFHQSLKFVCLKETVFTHIRRRVLRSLVYVYTVLLVSQYLFVTWTIAGKLLDLFINNRHKN